MRIILILRLPPSLMVVFVLSPKCWIMFFVTPSTSVDQEMSIDVEVRSYSALFRMPCVCTFSHGTLPNRSVVLVHVVMNLKTLVHLDLVARQEVSRM